MRNLLILLGLLASPAQAIECVDNAEENHVQKTWTVQVPQEIVREVVENAGTMTVTIGEFLAEIDVSTSGHGEAQGRVTGERLVLISQDGTAGQILHHDTFADSCQRQAIADTNAPVSNTRTCTIPALVRSLDISQIPRLDRDLTIVVIARIDRQAICNVQTGPGVAQTETSEVAISAGLGLGTITRIEVSYTDTTPPPPPTSGDNCAARPIPCCCESYYLEGHYKVSYSHGVQTLGDWCLSCGFCGPPPPVTCPTVSAEDRCDDQPTCRDRSSGAATTFEFRHYGVPDNSFPRMTLSCRGCRENPNDQGLPGFPDEQGTSPCEVYEADAAGLWCPESEAVNLTEGGTCYRDGVAGDRVCYSCSNCCHQRAALDIDPDLVDLAAMVRLALFIPYTGLYLPDGLPVGTPNRCVGGDGRTFDAYSNGVRFETNVETVFHANQQLDPTTTAYSTRFGATTSYDNFSIPDPDPTGRWFECQPQGSPDVEETVPVSDNSYTVDIDQWTDCDGQHVRFNFHVHAGAPMSIQLQAPQINGDFELTLTRADPTSGSVRWTLTGNHDHFPAYELYVGVPNFGELADSNTYEPTQLYGYTPADTDAGPWWLLGLPFVLTDAAQRTVSTSGTFVLPLP